MSATDILVCTKRNIVHNKDIYDFSFSWSHDLSLAYTLLSSLSSSLSSCSSFFQSLFCSLWIIPLSSLCFNVLSLLTILSAVFTLLRLLPFIFQSLSPLHFLRFFPWVLTLSIIGHQYHSDNTLILCQRDSIRVWLTMDTSRLHVTSLTRKPSDVI